MSVGFGRFLLAFAKDFSPDNNVVWIHHVDSLSAVVFEEHQKLIR